MDNEQERNGHFQGFANLLIQEIDEQVGAVTEWGIEHDIDSQEKVGQELYSRWQTIIARRAYDLVGHTLSTESLGWRPLESISVADIPDLTKWPT